jgi:hypothetical protein
MRAFTRTITFSAPQASTAARAGNFGRTIQAGIAPVVQVIRSNVLVRGITSSIGFLLTISRNALARYSSRTPMRAGAIGSGRLQSKLLGGQRATAVHGGANDAIVIHQSESVAIIGDGEHTSEEL